MKKKIAIALFLVLLTTLVTSIAIGRASTRGYGQIDIPYVENFPKLPNPLVIRNWQETALDYNSLAFNTTASGTNLPLIWMTNVTTPTNGGFSGETFGLPSYVGGASSGFGEALSTIGAVLGGSLAGADKTNDRGKDWVKMCEVYYSVINGHGLVLNNVNMSNSNGTYWYDIFPSLLFYHVGSLYPGHATYESKMQAIADSWLTALPTLYNNWDHTGFTFSNMSTIDRGWVEPDAAIGIAYLEYMAYLKWGNGSYLTAADNCMTQMSARTSNPYYEILGSYGPYLAARMNAELGRSYPVDKFLSFVFTNTSNSRPGWGVENGRWGNYDAYGLSGSTTDSNGYAFAMNTFTTAGVVAPMVRYDYRYSRAIGRWLLQVAANSNLFYPDTLPSNMQSEYSWYQSTGVDSISYEGVRNNGTTQPYATGDASSPVKDFNPYGAWGAGFMSALFKPTNEAGILQIDVLKTDFDHAAAYPTYLYYNPYTSDKSVQIDVGTTPKDLYDAVTKTFAARNVTGTTSFNLPADQARLLVLAPAGGVVTWNNAIMYVNNVIVDYAGNNPSITPTPTPVLTPASMLVENFNGVNDWGEASNASISANGGIGTVTNTGSTWGQIKKSVNYNIDTYPQLQITVPEVGSGAKWALKVEDSLNNYYLQGDTTATGTFTYDIKVATGWSGTKAFKILLVPVGGSGKYFKVDALYAAGASAPTNTLLEDFNDVSDWVNATDASIYTSGGVATVTNTNGTWGHIEKTVTYNVDAYPKLQITVPEVGSGALWALKVYDSAENYYLQGDTANTGTFTYDLREITGWSGTKTFKLMLIPVGGNGKYFKEDSIYAVGSSAANNILLENFYSVSDWGGAANASISTGSGIGVVTNTNGTWGQIGKSVTYDVDAYPKLQIMVPEVGSGAMWALKVDDSSNNYYLQGDTAGTGTFTYDLSEVTGWSGTKTFNILLISVGGNGKYFKVDNIYAGN